MVAIEVKSGVPKSVAVLVIGAGPVGLSLAIELRLHGVEVLVVERDLEIFDGHPKGRANDLRRLEHYHRWGVSGELRRLAWKTRDPNQKVIITNSIVEPPLGAFPLQYGRHVDESGEYAAEPSLSVPQAITTRVLQKRAVELGTQIFRGWHAVSIEQDAAKATTRLKSPTGAVHSVTSSYVVGCDGPDSLVRSVRNLTERRRAHSSDAHDSLAFLVVLNPKACAVISIPDDEHWGFSFQVADDAPPPADDEIQRVGQAVLGVNVPLSVVSSSSYKIFTRVAESYRTGRLFIAGDAAHLCPPTGGHNMNVGIGDAVNLAWKIAGVLQGWGGEKLLQSYDVERRTIANIVTSSALDHQTAMAKVAEVFRSLPPLDAKAGQQERFRTGDIAYQMTYPQWNSLGTVLGQRYDESPLTIRDDWVAPPYSGSEYWHHASPGHRAPHLWLDGKPLLDHFGEVFTLLDVEASGEQVARFLDAANRVGLPLRRFKLSAALARSNYPAEITIIRPGQYISWQGNQCSDPASIINKI